MGKRIPPGLAFAPYIVLAFSVLVVFYPGRVAPDTIDMCDQAFRRTYSDWHSPVIAGIWGFFRFPLEFLFFGQILGFVAAVGSILRKYLRTGVAILATSLVTWSPATLGWLSHVGKDQWFCVAILGVIATLGTAARTEKQSRHRRALLAIAIVLAWLAVATRANAAIAVFGVLVAFRHVLTSRPDGTRSSRASGVRTALVPTVVTLVLIVSTQTFSNLVVRPAATHVEQATMSFDLAGMSERLDTLLIPETFLDTNTSLIDVDRSYNPKEGEGWFFLAESPLRYPVYSGSDVTDLRNAWTSEIAAHPFSYLSVRLEYLSAQMGISRAHPLGSVNDTGSRAEDWGMTCTQRSPVVPEIHDHVNNWLSFVDRTNLLRGWVFALLLIAATSLCWRARYPEARALLYAAIANELTFALFGISPTFRYVWFLAVAAQLTAALASARIPRLGR